MISIIFLYDEYIDRPKLSEQKNPFEYIVPPPTSGVGTIIILRWQAVIDLSQWQQPLGGKIFPIVNSFFVYFSNTHMVAPLFAFKSKKFLFWLHSSSIWLDEKNIYCIKQLLRNFKVIWYCKGSGTRKLTIVCFAQIRVELNVILSNGRCVAPDRHFVHQIAAHHIFPCPSNGVVGINCREDEVLRHHSSLFKCKSWTPIW